MAGVFELGFREPRQSGAPNSAVKPECYHRATYMLVDDSERDDFFTEVVQVGHNRSDFEIDERENPMQGEEVQAVTGTATVTQSSADARKRIVSGMAQPGSPTSPLISHAASSTSLNRGPPTNLSSPRYAPNPRPWRGFLISRVLAPSETSARRSERLDDPVFCAPPPQRDSGAQLTPFA